MNWYSLAGGYGVFIEPVVGSSPPLHVALPVLFGMGGAGLVRHTGKGTWDDQCEVELPETDLFFIVEPAIDLELNLTSFFRLAVTISYRFTSDVNLTGKAPDVLQGVNSMLTLMLEKF